MCCPLDVSPGFITISAYSLSTALPSSTQIRDVLRAAYGADFAVSFATLGIDAVYPALQGRRPVVGREEIHSGSTSSLTLRALRSLGSSLRMTSPSRPQKDLLNVHYGCVSVTAT